MRYNLFMRDDSNGIDDAKDHEFERVLSELASFRYLLRKFLRFSESAARELEITPQQHQLMLGIAGFTGSGKATVSELAEFLQERHHSVVGLIDRAELSGLVRRENAPGDRRVVVVSLTPRGRNILRKLSFKHRDELKQLREELLKLATESHVKSVPESSTPQTSEKESHPTATDL
ncbi:MAG TPA: MarR family transcriptional regulator [Edaphobacter sp.]|nr:MarR family transcriptional regulator [Edaphobacter sp.]